MDLFDRLQDELLIHIIGFLPTKQAVLTSALSRRWKLLWCYATNSLAFDDSLSFHNEHAGYYDLTESHRNFPFLNFVDRVLKLSKVPQVQNFHLKMYSWRWRFPRDNPVRSWLDEIVTKRQAKEISIDFSLTLCHSDLRFPLQTFLHSASLRILKLYFGCDIPVRVDDDESRCLFLPNLKILHFWMIGICRKFWLFKHIFRASPQLEEAYFGGYLLKDNLFCSIYSSSLKRLRMKFHSVDKSNKFLINAPILEDLVLVDQSFQHHVVKSNCLVKAKIDIGFPHIRKFPRQQTHIHRVCKLLCRISHGIKVLNLRAHTMDALSICCNSKHCNLPHFSVLRHLKLCFLNYSSWDVISNLLECAPNLQALVLTKNFKGDDSQFQRDSVWIQPSSVPACLLSSLREVQVSDCESHQVEFDFITYFLNYGDVLTTFQVDLLPADSRYDLRFKEKLMLIPRASITCELKVLVYPHPSQRSSCPDEKKWHLAKVLQLKMSPEKMCLEDLRVCTDYFSDDRLIIRTRKFKLYRGKVYPSSPFDPPVRDVVVKKWVIRARSPYGEHKEKALSSFREELKLLEHPNFKYHPYFMSLCGYCAEDYNERLGVVYNFKPLDCLQNLIPEDSFKWFQRIKVALVLACISDYMQKKHRDLPSVSPRLNPSSVILDEDYMPVLFNFNRRRGCFRENDKYGDSIGSRCHISRSESDVYTFGLTLLGLISKRVHRCPNGRPHTHECLVMSEWANMQKEDRYNSSSLCKSQVPLVHKNLVDDSTYNIVDGLKITRLAMRCLDAPLRRPSKHGIIKYMCKLRVIKENWDVLNCDNIIGPLYCENIIGDHLNVLDS